MPGNRLENDKYQRFFLSCYNWSPEMFTYIVKCEGSGLLKIGKSASPEYRLQTMQTGCPFRLSIVWCWPEDIESELHIHFEGRRANGEWFDVEVDEVIQVAAWASKNRCRRVLKPPYTTGTRGSL